MLIFILSLVVKLAFELQRCTLASFRPDRILTCASILMSGGHGKC